MKIIAFQSTKGGSGTTAIAIHTAFNLAKHFRVLFIQTNPFPDIKVIYNLSENSSIESFIEFLKNNESAESTIEKICHKTHKLNILVQRLKASDDNFNSLSETLNLIDNIFDYIVLDIGTNLELIEKTSTLELQKINVINPDPQSIGTIKLIAEDDIIVINQTTTSTPKKIIQEFLYDNKLVFLPKVDDDLRDFLSFGLPITNKNFQSGINEIIQNN